MLVIEAEVVPGKQADNDRAAGGARRTFAIISHPDAGKTTLTEKLLHEGGAIREAGEVFSKGNRRRARSDWMAIDQQRGISVTSSVITFEHEGIRSNLLRSEEHTSELQSLMRISYAVFCLKKTYTHLPTLTLYTTA